MRARVRAAARARRRVRLRVRARFKANEARVCNAIERCCRLGSRTTTTSSMQTVSPGLRFSLNKKRGSGASGAPTTRFCSISAALSTPEWNDGDVAASLKGQRQ